jgi:hypothetical protein
MIRARKFSRAIGMTVDTGLDPHVTWRFNRWFPFGVGTICPRSRCGWRMRPPQEDNHPHDSRDEAGEDPRAT